MSLYKENKSQMSWKVLKCVAGKVRSDRSCEKRRNITMSQAGMEYTEHEGRLTGLVTSWVRTVF